MKPKRMSQRALEELAQKIDQHIRGARVACSRRELHSLKRIEVPRALMVSFASLAWRAGVPKTGLSLLNGIVRSGRNTGIVATDTEKVEYANCLIKVGALEEARELLQTVDDTKVPQALLYGAATFLGKWDCHSAIPLLVRYVESEGIDDYQRLIGEANLASSYLYERDFDRASVLLEQLVAATQGEAHRLLHANVLQLMAYLCLSENQLVRAEKLLGEAGALLEDSQSLDQMFIRKWMAVLKLYAEGPTPSALAAIERIRNEARERKHWETVRDCDRFEAKFTKDRQLTTYLWFGTPYASFRNRLQDEAPEMELPDSFVWDVGGSAGKSREVDTLNPIGNAKRSALRSGGTLHRLLLLLSADFYRPQRIATLFSQLFPKEHFNPESSAARVHQSIKLLRRWFEENSIPLEIVSDDGFYRLESSKGCRLRLYRDREDIQKYQLQIQHLRRQGSIQPFSASDAAQVLGVSVRTANRILSLAIGRGEIIKVNHGSGTLYEFRERIAA